MKFFSLIFFILLKTVMSKIEMQTTENKIYEEFGDHSKVIKADVFPYVASVLQKSSYLCAGALIDQNWVLTAADSLFLTRETMKTLRVRLGSINYKKGGILLPVKMIHIHPYFDDKKPVYDLAMIMIPEPVRFTPTLKAIRLQRQVTEPIATHFIVTSWFRSNYNPKKLTSIEAIERHRVLSVSHLHPTDPEECDNEQEFLGINQTDTVMCLDPPLYGDPCERDVGAPVVLNGILWGIVSSWKPADCRELAAGSSYVALVAAPDVKPWIHATMHGHKWKHKNDK